MRAATTRASGIRRAIQLSALLGQGADAVLGPGRARFRALQAANGRLWAAAGAAGQVVMLNCIEAGLRHAFRHHPRREGRAAGVARPCGARSSSRRRPRRAALLGLLAQATRKAHGPAERTTVSRAASTPRRDAASLGQHLRAAGGARGCGRRRPRNRANVWHVAGADVLGLRTRFSMGWRRRLARSSTGAIPSST